MRIEISNYEEKPKAVDIDFEFGLILVNLTFSKKDLQQLKKLVDETLSEWKKEEEASR